MANCKPRMWNKRDPNTPKDAVYVGRPTKWGNPFRVGDPDSIHPIEVNKMDRDWVVSRFDSWIHCDLNAKPLYDAAKVELKGKDLVCWCAPKSCHADVLLRIANDGGGDDE